jgi:hypothetical protein
MRYLHRIAPPGEIFDETDVTTTVFTQNEVYTLFIQEVLRRTGRPSFFGAILLNFENDGGQLSRIVARLSSKHTFAELAAHYKVSE